MRGEGRRGAVRVGETGEAGCLSEAAETATSAEPAAVRARRAGVPKRCGNGASLVQTHFFSVYFCITLKTVFSATSGSALRCRAARCCRLRAHHLRPRATQTLSSKKFLPFS